MTDDQARALAKEGKAVVWIDGGLHATEVLGAQQLGEIVYQMVSRNDDETRRILNDVIILFVHANPDGNDLVADWYMRTPDPKQRTLNGLPRLYQKYIGHDDNRDFFASTQAETKNENRVLYHEWFPQLLYNHHQSGPAGTVVYSPPLRDPYNYNLDPALILGLQSVGAAMHTRLAIEEQARRDDALRRTVRRLVERRHSQHRDVPQHHRDAHGDDRQPDAAAHSARAAATDSVGRSRDARRAAGMAFPPVDRLLGLARPRGARLRVAHA